MNSYSEVYLYPEDYIASSAYYTNSTNQNFVMNIIANNGTEMGTVIGAYILAVSLSYKYLAIKYLSRQGDFIAGCLGSV